VSQFHKDENKETLFRRTDKALYKAKNNGRNRVEMEYMDIQN
jgi:PleD family two-component response regulator